MSSGLDGNAGRTGGDATGLSVWVPNGHTQGILGDIMAWKRSDPALVGQKKCLPISRSAVESSKRADGGRRPKAIREIPVKWLRDHMRGTREQVFDRYVNIFARLNGLVIGAVSTDMIVTGLRELWRTT